MEQQEGQTLVMHLELADEEPMEPEIDYYEPPGKLAVFVLPHNKR